MYKEYIKKMHIYTHINMCFIHRKITMVYSIVMELVRRRLVWILSKQSGK